MERTLSIIKPDGVEKNIIGEICKRFEDGGLRIVALRMMRLSAGQAGEFYAVHKERPFFADLVGYMSSGPVVAQVLEGENAIQCNRKIMGRSRSLAPAKRPWLTAKQLRAEASIECPPDLQCTTVAPAGSWCRCVSS